MKSSLNAGGLVWFVSHAVVVLGLFQAAAAAQFTGRVMDAKTGEAIAARVYVQRESDGRWLFVESADEKGTALPYREQWVPMPRSVELHTTVSAHPFRVDLKAGRHTVTIERGKEYFPLVREIVVKDEPQESAFRLKRWVNMASRGWYSGETHVHRRIEELSNVQVAEDLNVAFPVTFWTVRSDKPPGLEPSPLRRQGPSPFGPRRDHGHAMKSIDDTHVYFPRNTEYEIFSVGDRRHVLGAVFVLNHRSVFTHKAPPVRTIAELAHREGALLDLDKHSWPWSMMLVPIAKVDLFELSNNSVWRTEFGFRQSASKLPAYMNVERDAGGMTEWGWLNYGFENYYTLLNCGFRLQPTAGTASGVHPVPLGHSRVYVHLDEPFSGKTWIDGLRGGRSFVTTGPMLFAKLNGKHAGEVFLRESGAKPKPTVYSLRIEARGQRPPVVIEVIVNGKRSRTIKPQAARDADGAFTTRVDVDITLKRSSWVAVRYVERGEEGRFRFAHTAPWHIEFGDQPVRPRKQEVDYLIGRLDEEIKRNKDVLEPAALQEFIEAKRVYEEIAKRAQ